MTLPRMNIAQVRTHIKTNSHLVMLQPSSASSYILSQSKPDLSFRLMGMADLNTFAEKLKARAANRQRFHSILSGDSARIEPETRFELLIDEGKSFLCTEDVVNKVAHVGMWHCRISLSAVRFADYLFCSSIDPSDKSLGYFHTVRFADF